MIKAKQNDFFWGGLFIMVQYWLVLFSSIRQISNFWRIFLVFFAPVPMQRQWEGFFASSPRGLIGFRGNITQIIYAMGQY